MGSKPVLRCNVTKVRVRPKSGAIIQPCKKHLSPHISFSHSEQCHFFLLLPNALVIFIFYFYSLPDTSRILLGWFSLELSNLCSKINFHLA